MKSTGQIKVTSNKKRTSYLMVASLNISFLKKYEEIYSYLRRIYYFYDWFIWFAKLFILVWSSCPAKSTLIVIFFLIQLVIFSGKDYNPSPPPPLPLAEKVYYFRRDGLVDECLTVKLLFELKLLLEVELLLDVELLFNLELISEVELLFDLELLLDLE